MPGKAAKVVGGVATGAGVGYVAVEATSNSSAPSGGGSSGGAASNTATSADPGFLGGFIDVILANPAIAAILLLAGIALLYVGASEK